MAKAIKTICMEIIMYLTIVTMSGHVIAHFWDYYVTRSELSEIKRTLESVKATLNSMGHGYNRLKDEFSEIIKEENYNMPESVYRYNVKRDNAITKKPNDQNIFKNKDSISSAGRNTFRDKANVGSSSPIETSQIKDNKIFRNINYSRRSDFSEVVGKPLLRCLCKHITSFDECYDYENKNLDKAT